MNHKNTFPVLLVHGGAWAIPDEVVEEHLRGVREAQAKGWSILEKGGSALDAVEETVASMEEDEVFDAGCDEGSVPVCPRLAMEIVRRNPDSKFLNFIYQSLFSGLRRRR